MADLTPAQFDIACSPLDSKIFLTGAASCGKTTSGVERLRFLLQNDIPGNSILMLTPQRTLQEPYLDLLNSPEREAGGEVTPATVGGLARRTCDLFWPLVAEAAGFAHPDQPPIFLTLETAQYYMARLVHPLLQDQGYFESITIDRNRLYSQIIDNLNKAASVGFPHTEIGTRLDAAWYGEPVQWRVYTDAQDCASRFRCYCLEHNLLDFSLQLELFMDLLWPEPIVRDYLVQSYRHIIYDNVEEDIPRAHDLLRDWLPYFNSALLIYDEDGGFRRFLGADVESGLTLRDLCDRSVTFDQSFVNTGSVASLGSRLVGVLTPQGSAAFVAKTASSEQSPLSALRILHTRFYPQLLDAVAAEAADLVKRGLPPSEIVILAPYLSDALRFSITNRLQAQGLPWRTHRPSRSLRDEPASQALLTLAALAHPQWEIHPPRFDLAYALMQSIAGLDLVRAQLLTEIVYRVRDISLTSFDGIRSEVQDRITFVFGNRYTTLREWILSYRESEPLPLDHFLRKLFGDVLSQPGFGFHGNFDSVRVAASLVESVRKFRQALETVESKGIGREYLAMLGDGVIAAQYLEGWQVEQKDAVLVAPAHTFLMMNTPVTVQIWLDPGSAGWYERLSQPLTHPYVLSRGWAAQGPGRLWTDADEVLASRDALTRLSGGLLRRCRENIILAISELGESGFEQRGDLLKAFQQVLQSQETE
jgi:hypothetical protein